jgi:hypothetical protein
MGDFNYSQRVDEGGFMLLRNVISFAVAGFTTFAMINPVYAAGESALIAAVPGSIKTDPDSLKRAAASGQSKGWNVPTKSSGGLGLGGAWKFSTHRGEKGTVTFKDGKIVYGTGKNSGAFSGYTIMSNQKVPSAPVLVVLKAGSKQVWYMPFKKDGQMTLVNITNKTQWISLSK